MKLGHVRISGIKSAHYILVMQLIARQRNTHSNGRVNTIFDLSC